MKVLVTGSEGFIGKNTVKALEEKGFQVLKFSHSLGNEIRNFGEVEKAVNEAEIVVHLAAALSSDIPEQEMRDINVQGTKNVLKACEKKRIKQLVYASSIGVYGKVEGKATEQNLHNPRTVYEKSKSDAEKAVLEYLEVFPITIFRFPIVFGNNKWWISALKYVKKDFPIIGKGNNAFPVLYVKDVANAIAWSTGNKNAVGEIFNCGYEKAITQEEFFSIARKELGLYWNPKHVSVGLANLLGLLLGFFYKLKGKKTAFNPTNIRRLSESREFDNSKIFKAGWKPKYSLEEGIKEMAKEIGEKT